MQINEFRIFTPEEFEELKKIEKQTEDHFGYVYFAEYGKYIKIGRTKKIYNRMFALRSQAKNYSECGFGRIAISPKCTNYKKLEKLFHKHFKKYRKEGTELFDISFYDAIYEILGTNFPFLDESKIIEEKEIKMSESLKNYVLTGLLN